MVYRVEITPDAEVDLDDAYQYIARDSPENALRWWRRFFDVADNLSSLPEACSYAPENDVVPFEVRQKLYGSYRILFTIAGERVIVLHIRHAARLPLSPDEVRRPRLS